MYIVGESIEVLHCHRKILNSQKLSLIKICGHDEVPCMITFPPNYVIIVF